MSSASPYRVAWYRHAPVARIELHRTGERTTAIVHASVKPIVKGMIIAWLGAWVLGELAAIRLAAAASESLLPLFGGFALFFLAGWTLMGAWAAYALLWCYEGTEELTIDGEALTYRSQVRGWGRTRRIPLARFRGLFIRYDGLVASPDQVPDDAPVRMGFHTRWFTYRLTASVRHADALRILAELRPRTAFQRTAGPLV